MVYDTVVLLCFKAGAVVVVSALLVGIVPNVERLQPLAWWMLLPAPVLVLRGFGASAYADSICVRSTAVANTLIN